MQLFPKEMGKKYPMENLQEEEEEAYADVVIKH